MSNLVNTEHYLLTRAIFGALRRITLGKGRKLQLTGAIALSSEARHVVIVVHDGTRHVHGNTAGLIPANVEFGLRATRSTVYRSALTWKRLWKSNSRSFGSD